MAGTLGTGTLTTQQIASVAALWVTTSFVTPNATAIYSLDQIEAAAVAIDQAFNTTLANAELLLGGGTDTIIEALAAAIPSPFNGATTAQQTLLACYVLEKRAGVF